MTDKVQKIVKVTTRGGTIVEVGKTRQRDGEGAKVEKLGFNNAGDMVCFLESTEKMLEDTGTPVVVDRKTIIFNHAVDCFDVEELEPPLIQPATFIPKDGN